MRISLLALPILALVAGCIESGGSVATGANTSGGAATASINPHSEGGYGLLLTTAGNTCSAIYSNPLANGTELKSLNCSGGGSGNATLSYGSDGAPEKVTFGGLGIGSGTITF